MADGYHFSASIGDKSLYDSGDAVAYVTFKNNDSTRQSVSIPRRRFMRMPDEWSETVDSPISAFDPYKEVRFDDYIDIEIVKYEKDDDDNDYGAAGRKYDEDKHKRDSEGKFATKEGGDSLPDTTYSKTSKSDKPFKAKVSKSPSGKTVYDISDMGFRPVEEDADFKKKFEAGIDPKWIKKDLNYMNGAGFLLDDGRWYGFNEAMHSVLVRFATDEANINIIAANSSELEKVGWVASMTGMIRIEARKKGTLHAKIFHPMTSAQRYELRDYILANEIDPERVVIELANTMKDRPERLIRRSVGAAGKFDESKHKRDDDGKFSKKEGMSAEEPDSVTRSQTTKSESEFDLDNFRNLLDFDDVPYKLDRDFLRQAEDLEKSIDQIVYSNVSKGVNVSLFDNSDIFKSQGITREKLHEVFDTDETPLISKELFHHSTERPQLLNMIAHEREKLVENFPGMARYVELYDEMQKALDIGYKNRYDAADYLYRGTEIQELDSIAREGIGTGGKFPYANFTTDRERAFRFAFPYDNGAIFRVKKDASAKYTTSPGYTMMGEGDSFSGNIEDPQGFDYFYEQEHRIFTDKGSDLEIEVALPEHDPDDEKHTLEYYQKRYPFVKKFHLGGWDD